MATDSSVSSTEIFETIQKLEDNICGVVLGKRDIARFCLVALFSGEHILLEDVPGVGKTLMGKALARSIDGEFCRLQFTPDLLPSDIVGSSIFNSTSNEFVFNKGPIFRNFVLADEINRAPPRTQSALLEAMSDHQVSVDGITHSLPNPFMVIATQNPFEFEGTYVLPESQLDRFLIRISIGYPGREYEQDILTSHRDGEPVDVLGSIATAKQIRELQTTVRKVRVDDSISQYLLEIVEATRTSDELNVGVSTRGALVWYRACQALALIEGRDFVVPDDVKYLAVPVMAHRIKSANFSYENQRGSAEATIRRIVSGIPVPT